MSGARADDGIRTRDPHLGKVMLYQLSYIRLVLRELSSAVLNKYNQVRPVIANSKNMTCTTLPSFAPFELLPYFENKGGNANWAISAVVARFVHTEEVTGSNPVSPTGKGSIETSIPFSFALSSILSLSRRKGLRV